MSRHCASVSKLFRLIDDVDNVRVNCEGGRRVINLSDQTLYRIIQIIHGGGECHTVSRLNTKTLKETPEQFSYL